LCNVFRSEGYLHAKVEYDKLTQNVYFNPKLLIESLTSPQLNAFSLYPWCFEAFNYSSSDWKEQNRNFDKVFGMNTSTDHEKQYSKASNYSLPVGKFGDFLLSLRFDYQQSQIKQPLVDSNMVFREILKRWENLNWPLIFENEPLLAKNFCPSEKILMNLLLIHPEDLLLSYLFYFEEIGWEGRIEF
jgi:hypothetical protein